MKRVVVIHQGSSEADRGATSLRRAKHRVVLTQIHTRAALEALWSKPPDVFVIDLGRAPSHTREVALALRDRLATRAVPMVFAGGQSDKIAKTRRVLPDALYTTWPRIRSAVRSALARPPTNGLAPGVFAGYSGTPLPRKLGIKAESVVCLRGAPAGFEKTLGELPPGAKVRRRAGRPAHVVMLFSKTTGDLRRRFASAARGVADGGRLWMAWPKKASGLETDLDQSFVRRFGLDSGWVDYKIAAIDNTWSGLCFARRAAGSSRRP